MASMSTLSSNGFSMKSMAPAFIASTAMGTSPWPVITIEGIRTGSRAAFQEFDAAHVGHAQIGDQAAVSDGRRNRKKGGGGIVHADGEARHREQEGQRIPHRLFVIDDMDDVVTDLHRACLPRKPAA